MKNFAFVTLAVVIGIAAVGCGQSPTNSISADATVATAPHSHESWWCSEHGVPEEMCAQCSEKLARQFKAKGDWCQRHDRPESQCFICHPELEAKFAALYEAKYGKQPPKTEVH